MGPGMLVKMITWSALTVYGQLASALIPTVLLADLSTVMPVLGPGIHDFAPHRRRVEKSWMAGTSPAMTGRKGAMGIGQISRS